jgi:hypothetical protein
MKNDSDDLRRVFGVGWYRPEQWALLLSLSADRDELEATHAEWLAAARSSLKTLRAKGFWSGLTCCAGSLRYSRLRRLFFVDGFDPLVHTALPFIEKLEKGD